MIKITGVYMEDINNPGCNNGNYPEYTVTFDDGTEYTGITCRCGRGCSGTERMPVLGEVFKDIDEYIDMR